MKRESDEVIKEATLLCQDELELEAETLVKRQLATDPDNLDLLTKLGVIQTRLCKDAEAEATFRAVLVKDANHEDAVCGLGRLLDQALRTEEAEQLYRDYLLNNPVGHCALEDLCRLLLSEDRDDEAFQLARNQVEQYTDLPGAFDALRYILHIEEDRLEAELNDDRENEEIFRELMNNLIEQIDLVIKLGNISEAENFYAELDDDKTRLIGEMEQLIESAPTRQISIPKELLELLSRYKK